MGAYKTDLPFEVAEIIISEFWYSEHPSDDRIAFMTACPRICSLWRDVYASITSRDIYVPTVGYLFYLSSIIRTKKSSVYRPFLRKSTRTITCHVDLIKSTNDSAMFPYTVLSHMPNYVGFRKCFTNIQCINLEIKLLPGTPHMPLRGGSDQLIRTLVSIRLDKAKTRLSVLPIDWRVTVDDPPDIGEFNPGELKFRWTEFLTEVHRDMHQFSWLLRSMMVDTFHSSAAESSTCSDGARHFRHRTYCKEEGSDLWGINHRFWKASRNVKTIFSLLHDLFWDNSLSVELPRWRRDCSPERGFRGFRLHDGSKFAMRDGTVVLLL